MRLTTSATTRRRAGTTLAELLVSLTICAVVASAFFRTVHQSLRFLNDHTVLVEQRAQLQAAAHLSSSLLADASPPDGDLLALTDSSVSFRATIGIALACTTAGATAEITPLTLAAGVALSAFTDQPQAGDLVARFDEGPLASAADDHWELHTITGVHARTGACTSTPFADPVADASKPGWAFDLSPAPPTTSAAFPLRILRPQRLALYHSAPEWMLGFTEWNSVVGGWNLIQPVAGALTGGATGPAGVDLVWHDSLLAPGASPTSVASLHATFRAPTRAALRHPGRTPGVRLDSLGIRLPFRNRR